MKVRAKSKLIHGVGINDADYAVNPIIDSKRVMCKFYMEWSRMLERCYSDKYKKKRPTYEFCIVCKEWQTFSVFKEWMEKQDWQGKVLDKDILVKGNKIYSPDTCAFVSGATNNFVVDGMKDRGSHLIGSTFEKESGKFKSQCGNPFTLKNENLGRYSCARYASDAWRKRKHELACRLADLQTDERVSIALRLRYA